VVECGGLENRYGPFRSIEGSNPSPSALRARCRMATRHSDVSRLRSRGSHEFQRGSAAGRRQVGSFPPRSPGGMQRPAGSSLACEARSAGASGVSPGRLPQAIAYLCGVWRSREASALWSAGGTQVRRQFGTATLVRHTNWGPARRLAPASTRKRASPQARKRCPVGTILESRARTPSCASVRECPLSPTGSFRPDRVTIEWRQR
jgi:hypothetical protein